MRLAHALWPPSLNPEPTPRGRGDPAWDREVRRENSEVVEFSQYVQRPGSLVMQSHP